MLWDQIDEELYNRYIRGGTLQSICFNCRNYGHYASTCPLRQKGDSLDDNFNPLPSSILTPINVNVLRDKLAQHPDRDLVEFILNGFTFGFDIGYCGSVTAGQSKNLLSARKNPQAVKEPIQVIPLGPMLHCSPFGAVLKKDNTYRLILDLSVQLTQVFRGPITQYAIQVLMSLLI